MSNHETRLPGHTCCYDPNTHRRHVSRGLYVLVHPVLKSDIYKFRNDFESHRLEVEDETFGISGISSIDLQGLKGTTQRQVFKSEF